MYTKLVLNAPLENQAGVALDQCITKINDLAKSVNDVAELANQIKDTVPFGLNAEVAIKLLLNYDDNLFYSHAQVHFSKYGREPTTLNEMLLLTINTAVENYDQEIEQFLQALAPHVISSYTGFKKQFLGTIQHEDADLPALLFHDADRQTIVKKLPFKGAI